MSGLVTPPGCIDPTDVTTSATPGLSIALYPMAGMGHPVTQAACRDIMQNLSISVDKLIRNNRELSKHLITIYLIAHRKIPYTMKLPSFLNILKKSQGWQLGLDEEIKTTLI